MIGEQQTKQSSVYFCSLIEASITIVIISPQFGQLIWYSSRRFIDAFEKPIFLICFFEKELDSGGEGGIRTPG